MIALTSGRKMVRRTQTKPQFTMRLGQSYHCVPSAALTFECARWFGRIRKHSTIEAASTAMTVIGMSTTRSPKRPPTKVSA